MLANLVHFTAHLLHLAAEFLESPIARVRRRALAMPSISVDCPFHLLGKPFGGVVHAGGTKILDGHPHVADPALHVLGATALGLVPRLIRTGESLLEALHHLAPFALQPLGFIVAPRFAEFGDLASEFLHSPSKLFALLRSRSAVLLEPLPDLLHLALQPPGHLLNLAQLVLEFLGLLVLAVPQLAKLASDGVGPLLQFLTASHNLLSVGLGLAAFTHFTSLMILFTAAKMAANLFHSVANLTQLASEFLAGIGLAFSQLAKFTLDASRVLL